MLLARNLTGEAATLGPSIDFVIRLIHTLNTTLVLLVFVIVVPDEAVVGADHGVLEWKPRVSLQAKLIDVDQGALVTLLGSLLRRSVFVLVGVLDEPLSHSDLDTRLKDFLAEHRCQGVRHRVRLSVISWIRISFSAFTQCLVVRIGDLVGSHHKSFSPPVRDDSLLELGDGATGFRRASLVVQVHDESILAQVHARLSLLFQNMSTPDRVR